MKAGVEGIRRLRGVHGLREEPRFVTARAGETVILGCDVSPPLDGQQPPYVVEWFKFGVPIPFFINFRYYPPHVDPEYTVAPSVKGLSPGPQSPASAQGPGLGARSRGLSSPPPLTVADGPV
ncbi:unnamed protein product [Boreogadus saida]